MHELSIAVDLVELACEEARRRDVQVTALYVRVGALSGVVKEALAFSFDVAARGTALEAARLDIEEVPVAVWCPACSAERTLSSVRRRCPVCEAPTPDVVRGRELELVAIEVSDDGTANS